MKTLTLTTLTTLALLAGIASAEEAKQHPKEEAARLMERARDAKAAGRPDEARELAQQAERIQAELREREGAKKPGPHPDKHLPPHAKGPEAERLRHIMQALEHLHAAGLHEPARHVEEIAHNMRREIEERMKHEHAAAQKTKEKHAQKSKDHAELEEMRQQMRRMAEQIEQLRAELHKKAP